MIFIVPGTVISSCVMRALDVVDGVSQEMNESGMRHMYYIINTPVWWCSYGGPVPVLVSATCIAYIDRIYISV
jgi:hypothetical protein